MGVYALFERDFIQRTLNIIEQYDKYIVDNHDIDKKEKYDVTLLINCLLGLLILPKEKGLSRIPETLLSELSDWGISEAHIKKLRGKPTLRNVVKRLRNGTAHLRIEALGDNSQITQIKFQDADTGVVHTEIIMPVDVLKIFVKKLATILLEI